jgi:pyruvate-formate lyase-activating enzyme
MLVYCSDIGGIQKSGMFDDKVYVSIRGDVAEQVCENITSVENADEIVVLSYLLICQFVVTPSRILRFLRWHRQVLT